jgi:hypothetical protein
MKRKINIDKISIEHRPDGPYADIGLEWHYTYGNFDGWTRSEEEADEIISNYIKSAGGKS